MPALPCLLRQCGTSAFENPTPSQAPSPIGKRGPRFAKRLLFPFFRRLAAPDQAHGSFLSPDRKRSLLDKKVLDLPRRPVHCAPCRWPLPAWPAGKTCASAKAGPRHNCKKHPTVHAKGTCAAAAPAKCRPGRRPRPEREAPARAHEIPIRRLPEADRPANSPHREHDD